MTTLYQDNGDNTYVIYHPTEDGGCQAEVIWGEVNLPEGAIEGILIDFGDTKG